MKKIKKIALTVKMLFKDFWNLEIKGPRLAVATEKESVLIAQFKKNIRSSANKNSGGMTWKMFSLLLKIYVQLFDARRFLRWHVVSQPMFLGRAWQECIDALMQDSNWKTTWQPLIAEDRFGDPLHDPTIKESSGNRIVHTYHLLECKRSTEIKFEILETIVEFGGGYGNTCLLLRRLGFNGTYIIYDLPEFSSLQKFYLRGVGEDAVFFDEHRSKEQGQNILVSSSDELARVLVGANTSNSLFIATWSVSESPISIREKVLPMVSNFRYFLFGYQAQFDGVDNVAYFRNYTKTHSDVAWSEIFKNMWSGYYLFGKKK